MGPQSDGVRRRETPTRHLVTAPGDPPRVLLASSYDWPSTYRTVRMLAQAGLRVEVLADPGFLVGRSRAVARAHPARQPTIVADLEALLARERFDWVIVADDALFGALARLANPWWIRPWFPVAPGSTAAEFVRSKIAFADGCGTLGLPVPAYRRVGSATEALEAAAAFGFPAIGKTAHGFGGNAVRRLDDAAAVRSWWTGVRGPAIVQRFVSGRYATTEMLFARGRLLAYVTSLRTNYWPTPLSAATTREIIDLPAMRAIAERLGEHTRFDGLCGIDYIIDENGDPHLSELNPRPTPGYGVRADVTALFAAAVRERLAGVAREPVTIARSSGPMHHFPEALSFAATERTIDAAFGALESLRRLPFDEPRLAWRFAMRALRDGATVHAHRKRSRVS